MAYYINKEKNTFNKKQKEIATALRKDILNVIFSDKMKSLTSQHFAIDDLEALFITTAIFTASNLLSTYIKMCVPIHEIDNFFNIVFSQIKEEVIDDIKALDKESH